MTALTDKAKAIADGAPLVEGYAPNVIVALLRVMRDLPGIGRDQTASAQQGGYPYRGIEQITHHTQGLFARHGVVFSPRCVSYEIRDLLVNNKPWTDTIQQVEYDVYGPGGPADKIVVGPILCIGRDNSDKGANKGLTQAYKYALLQALNISDAKDDNDGTTQEADAHPEPVPWTVGMSKQHLAWRLGKDDVPDVAEAGLAWTWGKGPDLPVTKEAADELADLWLGRPMNAEPAEVPA